jgi:tetratricopeptide (TPR) repeat protein
VPVWHEATRDWVKAGRVVLLGITQEQHPDRCRLLAQWKGFNWPILHDPINIMTSDAVPIFVAIDEHGIVRDTSPRLETLEKEFVAKLFPDDARPNGQAKLTPEVPRGQARPDFSTLRRRAVQEGRSVAWRELGDALALWGGEERANAAIDAYTHAARLDSKDAPTLFRLGVCYRRRYDSGQRQIGDFQSAIDYWSRALDLDANQYIWRRRIQQYGPPLDKPYAFYDWVTEAEKEVAAGGEKPVALMVRPSGAEIAQPMKAFAGSAPLARSPDGEGKILRDQEGLIRAEVTVVPPRVHPGQAVRIHVVLRPDARRQVHWNNEAEPLRLWIDLPQGWQANGQLLVWPAEKQAVTGEDRSFDFDVKAPSGVEGKIRLSMYALYYVCEDAGGRCRFLRLDIPTELHIAK